MRYLDGSKQRVGALRDARIPTPAQLGVVGTPWHHARSGRAPTAEIREDGPLAAERA